MRFKLIIIVVLFSMSISKGENIINVNYNASNPEGKRLEKQTPDDEAESFNPLLPITINITNLPVGITANVNATFMGIPRTVSGSSPRFTLPPLSNAEVPSNNTPYSIVITSPPNESATYQNVAIPTTSPQPAPLTKANKFPNNSALQELGKYFPSIDATDFGLIVTSSNIPDYPYQGDKYSHIFLDQFGNTILGTIPQGISNRSFIVHIIYLTNRENPSQISYSIKQTKGSYNPTLLFNNAGQLGGFGTQGSNEKASTEPIEYAWAHQEFLLRTSTDNIEFEVSRNILNQEELLSLGSTLVAKHVLEMSKVFHGSFDIGLIRTNLADPTYQLVPSINDPNQMVVKQSNNGQRGIITAMVTFYTSPIILLEKYLFGSDIPNYKLTGRNFLDDHKIYERIFPAVGVSITDKAFKNLFLGLNWEIARGASVFSGFHFGEVNFFRIDNDFNFEESIINEAEYNLRMNKKWKQEFAIGANLDLLVVTNLFRP